MAPFRSTARLVAKGFHQKEGLDYDEVFNLVVKPPTVRVMLTIALSKGWAIHQFDFNNTFPNGDLAEDVYMSQPEGFSSQPHLVCKLQKALYGLKQAPRAWFIKLAQLFTVLASQTQNLTLLYSPALVLPLFWPMLTTSSSLAVTLLKS